MSVSVWVLLITAFFVFLVCFCNDSWKGTISLIAVILIAGISSKFAINAVLGHAYQVLIDGGPVFGDIPVRIDALSGWFIVLMNFTVLTGILYGRRYMMHFKKNEGNQSLHFASFIICHFAMLCILCIQNSLAFLYVWEIMTLSAFLLILFEYKKKETIVAGINFLIQSHICILFLIIGFIWASIRTNSYDFNSIQLYCASVKPAISLFMYLCLFTGFAIKAGLVPFHTWLPYAHPVAPSHVSGIMSGVMIKLGIFGILRMLILVNQNYLIIGYIILILSVISGLYGVILAIVQHNLKKLLAYHSIENIGIIGIGIGLGSIGIAKHDPYLAFTGFAGSLLHTFNHSLFKSLLFYGAGIIVQAIHTLNIDSMGGLIKRMPQTAFLFLIGAMAICGLPPLNGFISEFLIYLGLFEGITLGSIPLTTCFILSMTGLALIGGLAILCFAKVFGFIFLGTERIPFDQEVKEGEPSMLFPGYLIVIMILIIGLFPQTCIRLLINPVNNLTFSLSAALPELKMFDTLNSISRVSWVFILIVACILTIKYLLTGNKQTVITPTWGCGYIAPSIKMQYTASSFVRSFRKLVQPILIMNKKEENIEGILTNPIHSQTHPYDKIEAILIDLPLKYFNKIIGYVRIIQNGNVRHYILYGVLFIFLIVIFSLLGNATKYLIEIFKQI